MGVRLGLDVALGEIFEADAPGAAQLAPGGGVSGGEGGGGEEGTRSSVGNWKYRTGDGNSEARVRRSRGRMNWTGARERVLVTTACTHIHSVIDGNPSAVSFVPAHLNTNMHRRSIVCRPPLSRSLPFPSFSPVRARGQRCLDFAISTGPGTRALPSVTPPVSHPAH